jgi:hypothetical protein
MMLSWSSLLLPALLLGSSFNFRLEMDEAKEIAAQSPVLFLVQVTRMTRGVTGILVLSSVTG